MTTHLRIARPVTDLQRSATMYCTGLGLQRLAHFADHDGFDGVMVGEPNGAYHIELTYCRAHPVSPSPTPEDLLVFYLPERTDWQRRCAALVAAGFTVVPSLNPYWETNGRTFEDPDGYRLVVQCAAWSNNPESSQP